MKHLFAWADKFVETSDWRDIALIKLCLCSLGLLIGCVLPHKAKKPVLFASIAVFLATYLPLMNKFLSIVTLSGCKKER